MKFTTALTFLAGFVAAAPTPEGSAVEDPGHKMKFIDFAYGGSGCPQDSVGSNIAEDGSILSITYDNFGAYAGEDISLQDRRKFCNINMEIFVPHGFQFSIMKNDYRGYCYLDEGLRATHKASYYFSGSSSTITRTTPFHGPYDNDYTITDELIASSLVWSPCGTAALLNLKQEVAIKPYSDKEKIGIMDVGTSDHKFTQLFYIQWRECNPDEH